MPVLNNLGLVGNILSILVPPLGLLIHMLNILGLVGNILSILVPPGSLNACVNYPGSGGEYPLHTSPPQGLLNPVLTILGLVNNILYLLDPPRVS